MSQSLLQNDENYDSDVTYCPEVEQRKRVRKKTLLFQSKSYCIEKLEEMTDKVIKHYAVKKQEANKLMKTLKQFQPKNKGDQEAIHQLTNKLHNVKIANNQKPKNRSKNCNKNKNINNVDHNISQDVKHDFSDHDTKTILNQTTHDDVSQEAQYTSYYDIDTNEIINRISFEHNYANFDCTNNMLDSIINFNVPEELQQTYDVDIDEILNCINYDPSQDITQNCGDLCAVYDASQTYQDMYATEAINNINLETLQGFQDKFGALQTDASQTYQDSYATEAINNINLETLQGFQDKFGALQTNNILNNDDYDTPRMLQDTQTCETLKLEASQVPSFSNIKFDVSEKSKCISTNEALDVSNNTFEIFVKEHFSDHPVDDNKIIVHSDFKINKPKQEKSQQLMDKYLEPSTSCYDSTQTQTLNDFECSGENQMKGQTSSQTNEICTNKRSSSKTAIKKKTRGRQKKRVAQDNTQSTIHNYFSSQTENEKENKPINLEETRVTEMSPTEMKNNEIRLSLKQAVEMMEISKQNFKLRLQAKKEEILKLKNMQPSHKTEEASNLFNFANNSDNGEVGVQVDTCNLISKEEMLQNMRVLYEVSAQYKKKYKSKGIDIFSD